MSETGTCSACGQPAVRGESGAWWHSAVSCWTLRPFDPDLVGAHFVPKPEEPDE
jgi:hypothetical protein